MNPENSGGRPLPEKSPTSERSEHEANVERASAVELLALRTLHQIADIVDDESAARKVTNLIESLNMSWRMAYCEAVRLNPRHVEVSLEDRLDRGEV